MPINFFCASFFVKNFSTLNLEKKNSHLDPEIDDLTPKKMPVYFFIYHPLFQTETRILFNRSKIFFCQMDHHTG